ncbi:hypothetical protein AB0D49_29690 [Streptomyces sp. NPDC048290]|uniref:hypothetical protein n=1 Tax=Streptomyces sp. NPDC048290 TaxID=3155811 RepID=UPI0034331452
MLLLVVGGAQAVLGLALVTNSVAVATEIWGEGDASTPCCTTPGEDHAGIIVFVGVLALALAAWGIITSQKLHTRHTGLRVSAFAHGWTALLTAVAYFLVVPILGVALLAPAVLSVIRPNQPESRAWFDHQPR